MANTLDRVTYASLFRGYGATHEDELEQRKAIILRSIIASRAAAPDEAPRPSHESVAILPPDDTDDGAQRVFPVHCLPKALADIVNETALACLIPTSLPAACALAAVSEALGAGLELQPGKDPMHKVGGNLFLFAIAESGTGKGQSYKEIMRPLETLANQYAKAWERDVYPFLSAEREEAEAVVARLRKEMTKEPDADARTGMKQEMEAMKAKLAANEKALASRPVHNAGEATSEALARIVEGQHGQAVSIRTSEARGVIGVICGRYIKGASSSDENLYLSLYSREGVAISRCNAPTVKLETPTGAMLLMVQPDKAREMFSSASMTESGLMPRFLSFDSQAEAMDLPECDHVISEGARNRWAGLLEELMARYKYYEAEPHLIRLTDAAEEIFRTFNSETRTRRKRNGTAADIPSYAARWIENAWRLALVLHAGKHGARADAGNLDSSTAQEAIEIIRWFIDSQLGLLASGRHSRRKGRLSALMELVTGEGKTVRVLRKNHGFEREEIDSLVAEFAPLEIVRIETAGRPSEIVKIKHTGSQNPQNTQKVAKR